MAQINSVDYSQNADRLNRNTPTASSQQTEKNQTVEREQIQMQKIERSEPKTTNQFPLGNQIDVRG